MAKTLMYKLFKFGRLPQEIWDTLGEEEIVLADEGIRCSVLLRNFRAPGKISFWRRKRITSTLILTKKRFAAFGYINPIINIPLEDERMDKLQISVSERCVLSIAFDPGDFVDDASGGAEFRFSTPKAQEFYDALKNRYALLITDEEE